ncbi:MAG: alpha/beta hydrolase [Afipia sp.]|nr:alpha/beta hydrolase [Afipia sp.]
MFENFTKDVKRVNGVRINYVSGGRGEAVLLLHGYPQSLVLWHKIAPKLAEKYAVIAPDLRGYGESEKPTTDSDDSTLYNKRVMAKDMVCLMDELGIEKFHVVGHDRGVRVGHRLALDHPGRVKSLTSLDVKPTLEAFDEMDSDLAFAFFHWNLMRQPYPLPETMIGNSAEAYFDFLMERWCATPGAITPEAYEIYKRQFCNPETIHGTCSDYRAVSLDREHDRVDQGQKLECPVLLLWGANTKKRPGWQSGKATSMLDTWRTRAHSVEGRALDCGHFIPEEAPEELLAELQAFFAKSASR